MRPRGQSRPYPSDRELTVIEFVFMLTHHDRTVDDPLSVYKELRGTGLRYVGFKDIGPRCRCSATSASRPRTTG